jgi:isoquinoline 1-oxidoreductase beta subunit
MTPTRRVFLIGAAAVGGGFAVGYWLHDPGPNPLLKNAAADQHPFNAFVQIGEDGKVTVAVARAEMGQGVHTALAKLVADQLDVAWDQVRAVHPPTSKHYINPAAGGRQLEGAAARSWILGSCEGSGRVSRTGSSARCSSPARRRCAMPGSPCAAPATARHADQAWPSAGVSAKQLATSAGKVVGGPSGATFSYGELAREAENVALPEAVLPREGEPYRLVGMQAARLDTTNKVNGKAKFGIDVGHGEMLYAAVRSAPTLTGQLVTDPTKISDKRVRVSLGGLSARSRGGAQLLDCARRGQ